MAQPTLRETKIIQSIINLIQKRPGLNAEFIADDSAPPYSGQLRLFGDWGSISRPIRIAWRITPQQGQLLVFQLDSLKEQRPLLLADYIPESLAGQLQQHHLDYLDSIGNGSICAPPLYYEVSGRRQKAPKLLPNRSQQAAGVKIIFQLLKDPSLGAEPYRTIAQRSGVALGAVGPVIKELLAKQLLVETVDGRRQLTNLTALRQLWETGYLGRLRPKLQIDRCKLNAPWHLDNLPLLIKEQRLEDHILIGGELAASFYCDSQHPQSATLHLSPRSALKQMLQLRLTPSEEGSIIVMQQFAPNNAFGQRSPEGLQLADPRLVRGELLYLDNPNLLPLAQQLELLYLQPNEQQAGQ